MEISKEFTKDICEKLNKYQSNDRIHPFTCDNSSCGYEKYREYNGGNLIATEKGWICPCDKYKQDWYFESMIK